MRGQKSRGKRAAESLFLKRRSGGGFKRRILLLQVHGGLVYGLVGLNVSRLKPSRRSLAIVAPPLFIFFVLMNKPPR